MAMRVNMLSCRLISEAQARTKNGHPLHTTTGAARTSCSHAGIIISIEPASSGTVRIALTTKRRHMSVSSGFVVSSRVAVRGSSAMPQMGQEPGSPRITSGCMGQVYSMWDGFSNPSRRAGEPVPHWLSHMFEKESGQLVVHTLAAFLVTG